MSWGFNFLITLNRNHLVGKQRVTDFRKWISYSQVLCNKSYPRKTTDSSSLVLPSLLLGILHFCQAIFTAFLAQWAYFLALLNLYCLQKNQPFQNWLVPESLCVLQIGCYFQLPAHFFISSILFPSLPPLRNSKSMPQLVKNVLLYWRGVLLHWCVLFALWPDHPLGVRLLRGGFWLCWQKAAVVSVRVVALWVVNRSSLHDHP